MPRAKAADVILEILRRSDGELRGKTRLFKVFYFAHLYYAKARPGILTDWPIARMPEGPGISDSHKLFKGLIDDGLMEVEQTHVGPYPEYRYRLTKKGREAGDLPADARDAIGAATTFCEGMRATELSQLTHEQSRSWNEGKNGDILNIYIDIIPDDEYSARQGELNRLNAVLAGLIPED